MANMATHHNNLQAAGNAHCGLAALQESKLRGDVMQLIHEQFATDHDLQLNYIEPPSIRLLEEISIAEQKEAIREFVERFKKAKHKIKKSRPGYFRGVCQKYWKQNRERKKCDLLRRANMDANNDKLFRNNHRGAGLSKLIAEAIELLFTPASGLETSIIDKSIERRLTQLSDQQGIQALYEFCSAVMNHQERIRNMNAYLMNIITKKHVRETLTAMGFSEEDIERAFAKHKKQKTRPKLSVECIAEILIGLQKTDNSNPKRKMPANYIYRDCEVVCAENIFGAVVSENEKKMTHPERKRKLESESVGGSAKKRKLDTKETTDAKNTAQSVVNTAEDTDKVHANDEQEKERMGCSEFCVVCNERKKDHILIPCGHVCVCGECKKLCEDEHDKQGRVCPICRSKIDKIFKAFY
eukprot:CAMPEP_0197048018 /NCGR_PEP_ID=MMETSP1384-20130603/23428_1 /TAXON_ID=29189 /ORGANISM="Ammonia sp." /LENGTH=411 /DNA_ID=CAMNT_0042480061 /DNA_START=412 /DNA_END=1647 /DNA_ORIENTATION=-